MSTDLSLKDVRRVVEGMLTRRRAALESCRAGQLYLSILENDRKSIDALPAAGEKGAPHAEALKDADARHDGWGTAAYHLAEAILAAPDLPAALVEGADATRSHFLPDLKIVTARYLDEARAATDKKPLLKKHREALQAVPAPDGRTLYDWLKDHVDAGLAIDELLEQRADAPRVSRRGASFLRGTVLGHLSNFRAAVGDEVRGNPKLPRDLDARIFGYLDLVVETRRAGRDVVAEDEGDEPAPAPPVKPDPTPA